MVVVNARNMGVFQIVALEIPHFTPLHSE